MSSINSRSSLMSRALFALVAAAAALGCSGSSSSPSGAPLVTIADTGTAIAEDTAPWLTYPEGPYGLKIGDVFPNLTLPGYRDAGSDWVDISMIDYYDPDGTRGIYGIYFVIGAQWCPPCNAEADVLPDFWTKQYQPRGARFVTAITEDSRHAPATQVTVDEWITAHGINFDIVLDDGQQSLPKGNVGIPYNYLINPRTMKIIRIIQGFAKDTTIPGLNTLLKANHAPLLDAGVDSASPG